MLNVKIPGCKNLNVDKLVFDLNGTLACDGQLIKGVEKAINNLAKNFKVYILTADTRNNAQELLKDLEAELVLVEAQDGSRFKASFVENLGRKSVIAVGNGNNDSQMLKNAELGIAVLGPEGTAREAVLAASLICRSIEDVFAVLSNPDRLKATLRK